MFVRIRLPIGRPHPALLVIDRAIGSDQGLKYVYVVDSENKVQYRRIATGSLESDGLRVVSEGLKADDWVVVGALQQIRPRMQVQPERMPMPSLTGQGTESAEPNGVKTRPAEAKDQGAPSGKQGLGAEKQGAGKK
jgi:multidrug efflux system membrane fusion protein